jgi:hypothetical protein
MVVILEGLAGDEALVIDGLQRARPGAEVTPKEIELEMEMDSDATTAELSPDESQDASPAEVTSEEAKP